MEIKQVKRLLLMNALSTLQRKWIDSVDCSQYETALKAIDKASNERKLKRNRATIEIQFSCSTPRSELIRAGRVKRGVYTTEEVMKILNVCRSTACSVIRDMREAYNLPGEYPTGRIPKKAFNEWCRLNNKMQKANK